MVIFATITVGVTINSALITHAYAKMTTTGINGREGAYI